MTSGFDVVVGGGGHAGAEAALAAARLGARTLLLTVNLDHVAQMSCNPCIGGVAKGQLVREIDALGGEMALNTDATAIQTRMLNRSRGAAVLSPRAQCDKLVYQRRMKLVLERQPNLVVQQAMTVRLHTGPDRVTAVETEFGERWETRAVVLATGTFLNGKLHYGLRSFPGGRGGDPASTALAESLRADLGFEVGRLKTGTPARVLDRSINFTGMERQDSDPEPVPFAFRAPPADLPLPGGSRLPALPCYLTQSTAATARIIRENLDQSPLYAGRISGVGARYCPSFEDKVVRFPQHETHHIFLEPEGYLTGEYYLNGISTSLPPTVQWQLVRSLPGLENAHITRYAYAIEYDFVFPHQITNTLAARRWPNLFLAGQINGTSGYEEAAGQGLVAGINAARHAAGAAPVVVRRDQAYLGVMIDDLVTKEILEPYRLFTSRAEHRLHLRQDNADLRLADLGHAAGLLPAAEYQRVTALREEMAVARHALQTLRHHGATLWELLRQPGVLLAQLPGAPAISPRAAEQLEIEARYEVYRRREDALAADLQRLEEWPVPDGFDFAAVPSLGTEARAKLVKRRPATLAQAARIDGVTPADIALLQVRLHRVGAK